MRGRAGDLDADPAGLRYRRGRVALRRLPGRLYLVGRDGHIAFQGGEVPFGFKPEELAAAIEDELGTV